MATSEIFPSLRSLRNWLYGMTWELSIVER